MHEYFGLQRQSDSLIYQFDRRVLSDGTIAYQRRDQDLWITYRVQLGWVAYDEATQSITGRPWNILADAQNKDYPPEGEWVSKKEQKSYVYQLKYLPTKQHQ